MNFLEAQRIVRAFTGGLELRLLVALSGTANPLEIFLRAAANKNERAAKIRFLPFNTLRQALFAPPTADEQEVFLLLPWDFVPALDWRSGVPQESLSFSDVAAEADAFAAHLAQRSDARVLYLPAPMPPALADPNDNARLSAHLLSVAHGLGAEVLSADWFSLANYLGSGSPVGGMRLGQLAEKVVAAALGGRVSRKVIVTDLDNVLWHGVVGEDGVEGIACGPEGVGFPHFIYQTMLGRLERDGVLLTAVTRNDSDLALGPFRAGKTTLSEERFVSIVASYEAKSAQIRELASALNLGLDAFVFVDDNPIELAEVGTQLPGVLCLQFPTAEDAVPAFLDQLNGQFINGPKTDEDRERTAMYRRRLQGIAPSSLAGADLTHFLQDLHMSLVIQERTRGDRTRAVQLINKTNQFNLNGERLTDEEVGRILEDGGRLFTASLSDRTGSHGEILAFLINSAGVVESFVLSCRVFQRRVEHAFLTWLINSGCRPHALRFTPTPRNEPFRQFINAPSFSNADDLGGVLLDADRFAEDNAASLSLFEVTTLTNDSSGQLGQPTPAITSLP